MTRRGPQERQGSILQVRAYYSVAELARAGNVSRFTLLRLLRHNGITFLRVGRAYYVTLAEIQRKIPPLWRTLQVAAGMVRGAQRASGLLVSRSGVNERR